MYPYQQAAGTVYPGYDAQQQATAYAAAAGQVVYPTDPYQQQLYAQAYAQQQALYAQQYQQQGYILDPTTGYYYHPSQYATTTTVVPTTTTIPMMATTQMMHTTPLSTTPPPPPPQHQPTAVQYTPATGYQQSIYQPISQGPVVNPNSKLTALDILSKIEQYLHIIEKHQTRENYKHYSLYLDQLPDIELPSACQKILAQLGGAQTPLKNLKPTLYFFDYWFFRTARGVIPSITNPSANWTLVSAWDSAYKRLYQEKLRCEVQIVDLGNVEDVVHIIQSFDKTLNTWVERATKHYQSIAERGASPSINILTTEMLDQIKAAQQATLDEYNTYKNKKMSDLSVVKNIIDNVKDEMDNNNGNNNNNSNQDLNENMLGQQGNSNGNNMDFNNNNNHLHEYSDMTTHQQDDEYNAYQLKNDDGSDVHIGPGSHKRQKHNNTNNNDSFVDPQHDQVLLPHITPQQQQQAQEAAKHNDLQSLLDDLRGDTQDNDINNNNNTTNNTNNKNSSFSSHSTPIDLTGGDDGGFTALEQADQKHQQQNAARAAAQGNQIATSSSMGSTFFTAYFTKRIAARGDTPHEPTAISTYYYYPQRYPEILKNEVERNNTDPEYAQLPNFGYFNIHRPNAFITAIMAQVISPQTTNIEYFSSIGVGAAGGAGENNNTTSATNQVNQMGNKPEYIPMICSLCGFICADGLMKRFHLLQHQIQDKENIKNYAQIHIPAVEAQSIQLRNANTTAANSGDVKQQVDDGSSSSSSNNNNIKEEVVDGTNNSSFTTTIKSEEEIKQEDDFAAVLASFLSGSSGTDGDKVNNIINKKPSNMSNLTLEQYKTIDSSKKVKQRSYYLDADSWAMYSSVHTSSLPYYHKVILPIAYIKENAKRVVDEYEIEQGYEPEPDEDHDDNNIKVDTDDDLIKREVEIRAAAAAATTTTTTLSFDNETENYLIKKE